VRDPIDVRDHPPVKDTEPEAVLLTVTDPEIDGELVDVLEKLEDPVVLIIVPVPIKELDTELEIVLERLEDPEIVWLSEDDDESLGDPV